MPRKTFFALVFESFRLLFRSIFVVVIAVFNISISNISNASVLEYVFNCCCVGGTLQWYVFQRGTYVCTISIANSMQID